MRFVLIFAAQVLRWVAVVVSIAVFANSQNASSTAPNRNQFYKVQLSTGQVVADTFVGTHLQGAVNLVSEGAAGWTLVGVGDFHHNGDKGLVYSESSGALAVIFYGGPDGTTLRDFRSLASPGAGWTARAVADLNGDGHPDVIFANKATGQVDVYFYGGQQGTSFLSSETIGPLSATGWNVVGVTDLNADGHPDLILQNPSTRQVLIHHLGGSKGTTVTATEELSGPGFAGWTAAGMQDINGDGHPDLILVNDATGQSRVNFFGGPLGTVYQGADYLDVSGSPGWNIVIPSGTGRTSNVTNSVAAQTPIPGDAGAIPDSQVVVAPQLYAGASPVLIFNGTGTSSTDVTAVINVVKTAGLGYKTVNSSQLDGMTQSQLAAYKLFIVPGGDSVKIGNSLSSRATTNVHNAVSQNGLNYLGFCAGGFFGGFSRYNGLNLTSGVWFSLYADYYKGIHKEAVTISFPSGKKLDIYWQNGPDLSGWGSVVGKYPNGRPALTEGHWGNGFVLLSGVHPEAPANWRYGMQFNTPLDVDLAYAATLVTSALNGTMLPHY